MKKYNMWYVASLKNIVIFQTQHEKSWLTFGTICTWNKLVEKYVLNFFFQVYVHVPSILPLLYIKWFFKSFTSERDERSDWQLFLFNVLVNILYLYVFMQVFIFFSVIVSLLVEVLALKLLKGMHHCCSSIVMYKVFLGRSIERNWIEMKKIYC